MKSYLVSEFCQFYEEYRCIGAPQNPMRVYRLVECLYEHYREWLSAMEFMAVVINTLYGVFARFDPDKYKGDLAIQNHFVNFFKKSLWGNLNKTVWPRSNTSRLRERHAHRERHSLQTEWAKDAVREAVEKLPKDEQTVIQARYWEDSSFRQIGAKISKDHKTVKNWHDRAIDKLRDQLTN